MLWILFVLLLCTQIFTKLSVSLKMWDGFGPLIPGVFSDIGKKETKRDKIVEKAVGGFTTSTLEMRGKGET